MGENQNRIALTQCYIVCRKRSEMSEIIDDNVIRSETLEMDRGEREERMVDIYESLDAVRNDEVMINTEMMSTERQQELQHTGRVSVKNRRHRSVQVCLCLLSVLLFTAVIVIYVYFNNERNQLLTHNYNLTKERDELLTRNYNLTKENETYSSLLLNQSRILTEESEKIRNKSDELQDALKDRCADSLTWIHYNFSYISSDFKNWSDSRRDCEEKGANLVIINNKEEQEFVLKATAGFNFWIGLSKEGGVLKWVDGTTLTLRPWMKGHPISNNHSCAVITTPEWADHTCDKTHRWICEKRIMQ
nr:asialoglycoprotein receptor 1-like [Misgurnus anguillicaudatus]